MPSQSHEPAGEHPLSIPPAARAPSHSKYSTSNRTRELTRPGRGGQRARNNSTFGYYFERLLPAHRKYFGRSRRTCLIVGSCVVLAILVLIIGLAAGLSTRSKSQNLPFPSNTETFTGELTYYSPALGACGITSSETDDVCSLSHTLFDAAQKGSDPNANPLCGLRIRAARFDEQVAERRSVDLTVVDRCVGCDPTDLDLSPGAFNKLANPDRGRVDVSWAWLSAPPTSR
ncbi:MAG: hypothetical protein M1837_007377 [Sclerophora amabilis]|nr:MAG: hypothetical protein M1837_007377 [Sclerophora amabilis]